MLAACVACAANPDTIDAGPVLCPFRAITGLPCPGCGLTRAVTWTVHGRLGDAAVTNPFAIVLLAVLGLLLVLRIASTVSERVAMPAGVNALVSARWLVLLLWVPWVTWGAARLVWYAATPATY